MIVVGILWGDGEEPVSQADQARANREARRNADRVHRNAGDSHQQETTTWWGGTKKVENKPKTDFWGNEIKPKTDFWGNEVKPKTDFWGNEIKPKSKSWWD
jgi:hypothetical protein